MDEEEMTTRISLQTPERSRHRYPKCGPPYPAFIALQLRTGSLSGALFVRETQRGHSGNPALMSRAVINLLRAAGIRRGKFHHESSVAVGYCTCLRRRVAAGVTVPC